MRRFVADASHELRTPLTSIRGFAELYRQGAADRPGRPGHRLMRRIEDEAARMGAARRGPAAARPARPAAAARAGTPVDLLGLAADAVARRPGASPPTAHGRTCDGDGGAGAWSCSATSPGCARWLANLLSNALTHTPAGSPVEVRVGDRAADGEPGAAVEVRDHGPGLSPEAAEQVFERFYRADPSRTRAAGGTGLGLSIVAALVAAHGGTVQVDTDPGRGARFRVVLPLAPDAAG